MRRLTLGLLATVACGAPEVPGPNPPPRLLSVAQDVTPDFGPLEGGTKVRMIGHNINARATVTFCGVAAAETVVTAPHTIIATSPPHAEGVCSIQITNPDGDSVILAAEFRYGGQ